MFSYVIDPLKKYLQTDQVYDELLEELLINHWLKFMINNTPALLKYRESSYSQSTQTGIPQCQNGAAVLLLGNA